MANLTSMFWEQGRWKEAEDLEVQVMETGKREREMYFTLVGARSALPYPTLYVGSFVSSLARFVGRESVEQSTSKSTTATTQSLCSASNRQGKTRIRL
jgi:hypothetical protein